MFNPNKFKAKLVENGLNVSEMAEKLGMDGTSLYRRISNGNTFTVGEVDSITNILGLTRDEVNAIFFASDVA